MNRLPFLLSFLLLLCTKVSLAAHPDAKVFNFNEDVKKAYNLALSLQLEDAQIACDREKDLHPNNLAIYFIENYIDFFR
ncbi:MAG: hypothetical protein AAFV80_11235, partial [Bacteroidota bacterium]